MDDLERLLGPLDGNRVVDGVGGRSRRPRVDPLEVAKAASVVAVVPAVIRSRFEDVGRRVGREDDDASGRT